MRNGHRGTSTAEVVELLQGLIRNACVNDGSPESGQEVRNAELLRSYFAGSSLDVELYEPAPGRTSLVARLEGSDPQAPTLCLMGHTDVVPASPERWSRDPFGGELVEGEVWGRGAVDMLNLTASMAVATRLVAAGPRLRGSLVYVAVADEEAGGALGAGWLTENAWDSVAADYVLTEMGGVPVPGRGGLQLWLVVGEKGVAWKRLRIRGTPGHGSMPLGADNALVTAAEVISRLVAYRPLSRVDEAWRQRVAALEVDAELAAALVDPQRLSAALARLPDQGAARQFHALTHTTFSPNVLHSGSKTNVIPGEAILEVDIRLLPGETEEDVEAHLRSALGDLYARVEVSPITGQAATSSSTETPLWHALAKHMARAYPEATLLPSLIPAGTDARYFRHKGAICYGAGLFSDSMSLPEFWSRFHGDDERIDVESLELTTRLWLDLVPDFLA